MLFKAEICNLRTLSPSQGVRGNGNDSRITGRMLWWKVLRKPTVYLKSGKCASYESVTSGLCHWFWRVKIKDWCECAGSSLNCTYCIGIVYRAGVTWQVDFSIIYMCFMQRVSYKMSTYQSFTLPNTFSHRYFKYIRKRSFIVTHLQWIITRLCRLSQHYEVFQLLLDLQPAISLFFILTALISVSFSSSRQLSSTKKKKALKTLPAQNQTARLINIL